MANLSTKIKLYCEANSKTVNFDPETGNVHLKNDGAGDYIAKWSVDGLTKPTDSQLATYETAGNTAESNVTIDTKRQTEYLTWQEQLDKLYHDINDNKLDTNGTWYKHIKAVKDANPKG